MKRKIPGIAKRKLRLPSLGDLDKRTAAAKAAYELRDALLADAFANTEASAQQRCLIDNAAMLGCALNDLATRYLRGDTADMSLFATLANAQRRLLQDIGLARKARELNPDLRSYIKGRATA